MATQPLSIQKPGLSLGTLLLFTGLLVFSALFWGLASAFIGGILSSILFIILAAATLVFSNHRLGIYLLAIFMPIADTSLNAHSMFGITGANPYNLILVGTVFAFTISYAWNQRALINLPKWFWLYALALVVAGLIGSRHVGEIPSLFAQEGIGFDNAAGYLRNILGKPLLVMLFTYIVAQAVYHGMSPLRLVVLVLIGFWLFALAIIAYLALSGFSLSFLASTHARTVLDVFALHADQMGVAFNLAIAVTLFTWASLPAGKLKLFFLLTLGILTAVMLLTFSRGAFLGYAVIFSYFLVTRRRIRTLISGIAVVGIALLLLPAAFFHRATMGFGSDNLSTVSAGRINDIWMPLLPEVWHHPLFGNGLSSILWSHAMRTGAILPVSLPHNAYLGVAMDFGLIGGALIAVFYIFLWRRFGAMAKDETDNVMKGLFQGARTAVLVLAVEGIANDKAMPEDHQAMLWIMAGILFGRMALLARGHKTPAS